MLLIGQGCLTDEMVILSHLHSLIAECLMGVPHLNNGAFICPYTLLFHDQLKPYKSDFHIGSSIPIIVLR